MSTPVTPPPVYLELGPTRHYDRRRAGWYAGAGEHTDGRTGTLRLVLYPVGRSDDATDIDEYGVQEEADEQKTLGARSFLLENDDDPDKYGPFRCIVGTVSRCDCEAGRQDQRRRYQTGCKHRSALRALVREGVFG